MPPADGQCEKVDQSLVAQIDAWQYGFTAASCRARAYYRRAGSKKGRSAGYYLRLPKVPWSPEVTTSFRAVFFIFILGINSPSFTHQFIFIHSFHSMKLSRCDMKAPGPQYGHYAAALWGCDLGQRLIYHTRMGMASVMFKVHVQLHLQDASQPHQL